MVKLGEMDSGFFYRAIGTDIKVRGDGIGPDIKIRWNCVQLLKEMPEEGLSLDDRLALKGFIENTKLPLFRAGAEERVRGWLEALEKIGLLTYNPKKQLYVVTETAKKADYLF